jgi:predicted permease
MMTSQSGSRRPARLPRLVAAVFRALLPHAERDEVLRDLQAEYDQRAAAGGRLAARRWAWRQATGSVPALLRRSWWRGMTGFEPRASRLRPGGPMFESWIIDARFAARRLVRRPAYAVLAVLTLALGAGGTAAIFSIARTLLLDPLPIAREDQVGIFWFGGSWTEQEFLRFRSNFPGFRQVAAYRPNDVTLENTGGPMRLLPGVAVSSEFFEVLGARSMLGRTFRAGEDAVGAELPVVLSHSVWQALGADPSMLGRQLRIGGLPRTVVGVMPPGFWFPSPATRVWTAAQLDPENRSGRYTLVGRVVEGASIDNMDAPLRALGAALAADFQYPAQWDKTKAPAITPAREFLVGDVRPSLRATLAAMVVILLIACGNVAALVLGQIDARATEMAVRTALGANRQRLVQQLIMESLLIGVLAGAAGALLSAAGFQVLVGSLPLGALAEHARLDWTLFWASMLASAAAAMLVAIVPGIAVWRGTTLQGTMATTRTGGVGGRGGRLEGGLVVVQVALAVLLVAGAGLLIRSVTNLRAIDPGVNTRGVAIVDATMPLRLTAADRRRVIADALPVLHALPGVTSVAGAQKIPLRGSGDNWGLRVRGRPDVAGVTTAFRMVTRDYFTAMGMPIVHGRNFGPSDREGSAPVVIINEALALAFFAGRDPIGQILETGSGDTGERIIGVVGNAAEADLTDPPVPARYMLYDHVPMTSPQVTFVLRTDADDRVPSVLVGARGALGREGVQLAIQEMSSMQSVFERAVGAAGQVVTLLTLLAGLALVLGAVGVYGVISHAVTRRARDYGIRIALGEPPPRVVWQVLGRGAVLVGIGSAIGLASALAATNALASLLYGVHATDPLSMASAVAVLLAVGLLAAFIPARRASVTDPAVVLRE